MPRSTVLVLAKEPLPGRVKTRLCPPLRPQDAAELAAAAIADTMAAVLASGAERHLLALDGSPGDWLPDSVEVVPQRGASFAARLADAWSHVDGPCVQIGMDTPQVTASDLDEALQLVTGPATAALGPAADGGWWALALRRPAPGVFAGVPMSTDRTFEEQVASLRRHGLDPRPLATMTDIDTIDDARAVCRLAPGTRTASTLRRLTAGSSVA
jgi:glycosyltransferase A (GT-A) superfamily protein (DUF2064 family)